MPIEVLCSLVPIVPADHVERCSGWTFCVHPQLRPSSEQFPIRFILPHHNLSLPLHQGVLVLHKARLLSHQQQLLPNHQKGHKRK